MCFKALSNTLIDAFLQEFANYYIGLSECSLVLPDPVNPVCRFFDVDPMAPSRWSAKFAQKFAQTPHRKVNAGRIRPKGTSSGG